MDSAETKEQANSQPKGEASANKAGGGRRDRAIKLAFLGVILGVGVWVYFNQSGPPPAFRQQWSDSDLDAAMARAKKEDRRVLAFFVAKGFSQTTRDLLKTTLGRKENHKAIADGKFIKVGVVVDWLDSDLAKRHGIKVLPTMLILGADGKELNRRQGRKIKGEVPFRTEFLSLKVVVAP